MLGTSIVKSLRPSSMSFFLMLRLGQHIPGGILKNISSRYQGKKRRRNLDRSRRSRTLVFFVLVTTLLLAGVLRAMNVCT